MPIDINAFRAISVKMDGDSLLYVQGDKLKTTSAREVSSDSLVHRQFKAARKAFLLEMLPLYHAHEKTFDKGTNWHGRTHATRSFVLSIAMANILRERGVALDINSVALVTAGHDTGRMGNGADHTVNMEMLNAATAGEAELKRQELNRINDEMERLETAQTETLSDQQIVELVEKSIRDNPQDFPLLAKYYLNAV